MGNEVSANEVWVPEESFYFFCKKLLPLSKAK